MPTGETMEKGDYSGAAAPEAVDSPESVTLSADLLGGVSAKNGDKITFCVTGDPDEDGNVPGYFEAQAEVEEEAPEEEESWEEGALKIGKEKQTEGRI